MSMCFGVVRDRTSFRAAVAGGYMEAKAMTGS
jgi:hypothetical protein